MSLVTIVIRTDASTRIGSGHVMRCLTLADELRQCGADVRFICRDYPGNLIGLIEGKGYKVVFLPGAAVKYAASTVDVAHAVWLGGSWQQDAIDTVLALEEMRPKWLVIDHYALDYRWERQLRPHVGGIMVIDDIADRPHDCDLLLDQNLYESMEIRYDGLVSDTCRKFLGPKHALLRPEFMKALRSMRDRDGKVRRILIFFGGSDPSNETAKTLEAIRLLNRPDIAVDAVVGGTNPHREEIRNICASMPNTTFQCQVTNMAELMAAADLAIGAGGTATWERCLLGLPSITLVLAKNQSETTKLVAKAGATLDMGHHGNVTIESLVNMIHLSLNNPPRLKDMGEKATRLMEKGIPINGSSLLQAMLGEDNGKT